jgi:hypothetical protein
MLARCMSVRISLAGLRWPPLRPADPNMRVHTVQVARASFSSWLCRFVLAYECILSLLFRWTCARPVLHFSDLTATDGAQKGT